MSVCRLPMRRWEGSDQVVSGLRWEQSEGQRSCCPQHEYSWDALGTQRSDPDEPALGLDPDCRRGYRRCRREKKCPWGETKYPTVVGRPSTLRGA